LYEAVAFRGIHLERPKTICKAETVYNNPLAVRESVRGNDVHPPPRKRTRHRREQQRTVGGDKGNLIYIRRIAEDQLNWVFFEAR
jgi:hypothetical protein